MGRASWWIAWYSRGLAIPMWTLLTAYLYAATFLLESMARWMLFKLLLRWGNMLRMPSGRLFLGASLPWPQFNDDVIGDRAME